MWEVWNVSYQTQSVHSRGHPKVMLSSCQMGLFILSAVEAELNQSISHMQILN